MLRNPFFQVALWTVAIGTILTVIILNADWLPSQASSQAGDIDAFFNILSVISAYIFGLVAAIMIVAVVHFRRRHGDMSDGKPIHGNTRLEVLWTSIPAVIMIVATVVAALLLAKIEEPQASTQTVQVQGRQFAWTFKYPQGFRSNELHLVKDQPYYFKLNSLDVIHDFWVAEFRMKKDAVPGITTTVRVTPIKTGRFSVVCAELCGLGHSTMRAPVVVEDQASWNRWAAKVKRNQATVGGDSSPSFE